MCCCGLVGEGERYSTSSEEEPLPAPAPPEEEDTKRRPLAGVEAPKAPSAPPAVLATKLPPAAPAPMEELNTADSPIMLLPSWESSSCSSGDSMPDREAAPKGVAAMMDVPPPARSSPPANAMLPATGVVLLDVPTLVTAREDSTAAALAPAPLAAPAAPLDAVDKGVSDALLSPFFLLGVASSL